MDPLRVSKCKLAILRTAALGFIAGCLYMIIDTTKSLIIHGLFNMECSSVYDCFGRLYFLMGFIAALSVMSLQTDIFCIHSLRRCCGKVTQTSNPNHLDHQPAPPQPRVQQIMPTEIIVPIPQEEMPPRPPPQVINPYQKVFRPVRSRHSTSEYSSTASAELSTHPQSAKSFKSVSMMSIRNSVRNTRGRVGDSDGKRCHSDCTHDHHQIVRPQTMGLDAVNENLSDVDSEHGTNYYEFQLQNNPRESLGIPDWRNSSPYDSSSRESHSQLRGSPASQISDRRRGGPEFAILGML